MGPQQVVVCGTSDAGVYLTVVPRGVANKTGSGQRGSDAPESMTNASNASEEVNHCQRHDGRGVLALLCINVS